MSSQSMQNMMVDQQQHEMLLLMRENTPDELEKWFQAAQKTAGKHRAFDPITLPEPGNPLQNRKMKNPSMGPPVVVCNFSSL
jgi:hypothetical protein